LARATCRMVWLLSAVSSLPLIFTFTLGMNPDLRSLQNAETLTVRQAA
jgi:hypothetical protein